MFNDNTMENNNNNISNDGVLAILIHEFGDEIQSDVLFEVCTKFNWNCKLYFLIGAEFALLN